MKNRLVWVLMSLVLLLELVLGPAVTKPLVGTFEMRGILVGPEGSSV